MNPLELFGWFHAHSKDIFAALGYFYAFALVVVKLTPTPKDDEILSKIYEAIHRVIGATGVKK